MKLDLSYIKDPNVFGELLRDLAFVKEREDDYGCYSTFKLEPGFTEIERKSELGRWLRTALCESPGWGPISMYKNDYFFVAWFWDGDGTLIVGYEDGDNMVAAINGDCKKPFRWEMI